MEGRVPQDNENKCLLALADALRSYSQRRCLDSSGGGTALDRLRNRGVSGIRIHTTKSIARLPVMDLMKAARMTWSVIVNQSDESRERRNLQGVATRMVNIDLSSVLFQLRLKMVSDANVADKRQMELHLLGLIEKLTTLVPHWVHLRKAPSALNSNKSLEKKLSKLEGKGGAPDNNKSTTRHSIIVIQNDSMDYVMGVRAKLGGRVHNPIGLAVNNNRMSKTGLSGLGKRSFRQMEDQQQLQNDAQRTLGAADALVPPSFRRLYGKALCLKEDSKMN